MAIVKLMTYDLYMPIFSIKAVWQTNMVVLWHIKQPSRTINYHIFLKELPSYWVHFLGKTDKTALIPLFPFRRVGFHCLNFQKEALKIKFGNAVMVDVLHTATAFLELLQWLWVNTNVNQQKLSNSKM